MNRDELKQRLIELLIQPICKPCIECKYFEKETGRPNEYCMAENRADHLLANGVTIRERGEWIPVTEGLPEKMQTQIKRGSYRYDKSVRVLCACRQKSGKTMVKEGYCEFFNNGVYWSIPGSIDSVTHWMPLPEPPESEKGGE